ncbi:hypothetical protein HK101_001304 [Irineochytrium annulatum]|nr:hypothetical protein HK101_001304 [Irineochytrium annulatum]
MGEKANGRLIPKSVARITTGGMVPDGADAVVMVEDTELVTTTGGFIVEEETVRIIAAASPGDNIREVGSDVTVGDLVMKKGDIISAAGGEVGLLASVGVTEVRVYRSPRVSMLSTGNELVDYRAPGPLNGPMVRDINFPSIAAAISAAIPSSIHLTKTPAISDNVEKLEMALRSALEISDVVITTGGVSMGESDFMKHVIENRLKGTIVFGRVLMKPGKPTTFATVPWTNASGKLHTKLVFALPGNPVSALVGFYLFVVPALKSLMGNSNPRLTNVTAKLAHQIKLDARPEFYRARIEVEIKDGIMALVAHGTGRAGAKTTVQAGDQVPAFLIAPM